MNIERQPVDQQVADLFLIECAEEVKVEHAGNLALFALESKRPEPECFWKKV